ncbi:hypothetical protein [Sporosarcina highlanderae]|uniref:Uncharacterized protein n=1 Tax=Sporosarcina highlanderae TaxID=3035916 RepID=A0ABT8JU74_9BACL|nr:hypothetical protein [Sporosarcina highlanderae]MDN4608353.1 hypothetical protein [Sporosarcina highlanderae]
MKIGRLIKTAIKWAPIVYPIARKLFSKEKATAIPRRR